MDLAEDLRGCLHDRDLRNAIHATILEPYELLVRTCVDLWDTDQDFPALEEAVHVAERSRARSLIERLSEEDLAPAQHLPPEQFAEFLRLRRERLMRRSLPSWRLRNAWSRSRCPYNVPSRRRDENSAGERPYSQPVPRTSIVAADEDRFARRSSAGQDSPFPPKTMQCGAIHSAG